MVSSNRGKPQLALASQTFVKPGYGLSFDADKRTAQKAAAEAYPQAATGISKLHLMLASQTFVKPGISSFLRRWFHIP